MAAVTVDEMRAIECGGGRTAPVLESHHLEGAGVETAECPSCGGRFHLDSIGLIPEHAIPVPLHAQIVLSRF
jgi:hypothetical protein